MNEQKPIKSCASTPSQFVHRFAPTCEQVEMYVAHLEGCVEGFTKSINHVPYVDIRKKLWIDVAIAVASSNNSTIKHSMESWANAALDAFDKRFKESNQ